MLFILIERDCRQRGYYVVRADDAEQARRLAHVNDSHLNDAIPLSLDGPASVLWEEHEALD